jgi:hypothetical protein
MATSCVPSLTRPRVACGRWMLQEYTRLKNRAGPADLAWRLVPDAMVFRGEAEVRWLDHCEASIPALPGRSSPGPERESLHARGAHSPRTTVHDADTDDITREATAR